MRQRNWFRLWVVLLFAGLLLNGRPASAATKAGHEVRKVGHKVAWGYDRAARNHHYRRARADRRHGHPALARRHQRKAFGYHRKAVKQRSQAR
jgi:hypothetical protein